MTRQLTYLFEFLSVRELEGDMTVEFEISEEISKVLLVVSALG